MNSRSLLLMLVGIVYAIGIAQAQPIESLLKEYDAKVPQEKNNHIHFDNSSYTPGQTVCYKAFVLKSNEPSDLSKNLYIDWFDEKGKFVDRLFNDLLPGLRRTPYWKPNILINNTNRKGGITFNNNDVNPSLRIVLEGLQPTED